MGSKLSQEKIIERFKSVHGETYDYSKVQYVEALKKVIIICKEHGEFQQTPAKHYNMKQNCPKCGFILNGESTRGRAKAIRAKLDVPFISNDAVAIPLTKGKITIVSREDYETVSKYNWSAGKRGYAVTYINGKLTTMHNLIIECPNGMLIDHVDRDKLNNRRDNLRLVTPQQNTFNSTPYSESGYKGVHKKRNKWLVQIVYNGKNVVRKTFDCPITAAKYYDSVIKQYHGEHAYLNFPNGD